MKFPIIFIIFLFVSFQPNFSLADIFSVTNKNIRIEVVDYRDFLEDVILWIHHSKDTPVVSQKLINNGIYPISVTISNDSNKAIKVIKNAIGGLSIVDERDVAQLYQYDTFARVIKNGSLSAFGALIGVKTFNFVTGSKVKKRMRQDWYKKLKYGLYSTCTVVAGIVRWSETATINAMISQAFQSYLLPEESIIDSDCSMTFLLFTSHAPSGHTLKVPIFDVQDNQVTSFSCSFGSVVAL